MEEQEKTSQGDVQIIASTAAKTVYVLFVAAAFVLTLLYMLLPLTASRVYSDLGDGYRAYDCASRAARVYDGERRVNAAIARVNSAALVYNEDATFADEVEDSTFDFLTDDACLARVPAIDSYNLSNSAKSLHANLYSYKDYLHSLNAKARARQGKTELLYNGAYRSADELLGEVDGTLETAILFGQLAAVIEERGADIVRAVALSEKAQTYIAEALSEPDALTRLYLVKAYERLYVRLCAVSADEVMLSGLSTVYYGGQAYEITELYYDTLLKNYCK